MRKVWVGYLGSVEKQTTDRPDASLTIIEYIGPRQFA